MKELNEDLEEKVKQQVSSKEKCVFDGIVKGEGVKKVQSTLH